MGETRKGTEGSGRNEQRDRGEWENRDHFPKAHGRDLELQGYG